LTGCPIYGANPLHFTGKERDTESGNDYFGARYYGSSMGRFMTPDPSTLEYADPTNPQSFNLYSYVLNNPLINFDPDGLKCLQVDTDGNFTGTSNAGDCATDANGNLTNNDVYIDDEQASNPFMDSNGDLLGYTNGSGQQVGADGNAFPNLGTLNANGSGTPLNDIDTEISPFAMQFIQDVNQDNQHQIGCIAQAYGIAVPGNAGAAALGAPLAPKRFAAWGASQGTSWLSKTLGNAYKGGSFPGKNYASPTGGLFSGGKPFEMGTTANFGKAFGRWAPFAVSAAATAYASYQLWNCLGK
jgi:RHS repeat-associated protein